MNKPLMALVACLGVTLCFNGSAKFQSGADVNTLPKVATSNVADSQSVLNALNDANSIEIKRDFWSSGFLFYVFADGKWVGDIKPTPIYGLGETYALFTTKGNLVSAEAEELHVKDVSKKEADWTDAPIIIPPITTVEKNYDYDSKFSGDIEQVSDSMTSSYKYNIRDKNTKIIGFATLSPLTGFKSNITNLNKVTIWQVSKADWSLSLAMTIDRKSNLKSMPAIDAVWTSMLEIEDDDPSSAPIHPS